MKICPDCHRVVTALDAIEMDGKSYHKSCRICYRCGKIIQDPFLSPKQVLQGHSYHLSCLNATQVCCICGKATHSYVRDFWGNFACPEHGSICLYCGKIAQHRKTFKYTYSLDGEKVLREEQVCDSCADSIILNSAEFFCKN